jgi:VWFA-related protein
MCFSRSSVFRAVAAAWILPGTLLALSFDDGQQLPQTPTFRTRTTLRAIEVRVVDQRNNPMTDLRQEDFTITEDGKPQEIRVFAPIALTAEAPVAAGVPLLRAANTRPADLTPVRRRIFLIVLGRGRLNIPSRGIDGMIRLVRDKLLPQDVVAVMAWNRATDFTTNHAQIVALLERYKHGHQKVEALLAQHFSGLAAIYGNRDMPPWMATEIDAVLRGPDLPGTRSIVPEPISTAAIDQGFRRNIDLLQGTAGFDVFGAATAETIGMSLDQYASSAVHSNQDLTRIYAALAYLRHVDGEKHLVYISPAGLHLPSTDDDRSLARIAQDARVVMDVFHSDGMSAGIWDVASSQNIAEFTGGQYTGVTYGERFADRIDAATRSGYQLGYYPANTALDGKYRKVTVQVKRRGATVLYQHGYYAREEVAAIDRRQVISQSRVEAALRYGEEVPDLAVRAAARRGKSADGKPEMIVQVNVDPAGIAIQGEGDSRTVSLDVAVFCLDRSSRQSYLVGYVWRRVTVQLDGARYDQFQKTGIGFTVHVPIRRSSNYVKAVLYDYHADRVGTVVPAIK